MVWLSHTDLFQFWFEHCGYMWRIGLPNVSPNYVIRLIGWFKLVRLRASGCHCRKMQKNNKFGAKILIWQQLLAEKNCWWKFLSGVGTSPRECHLPLKVIDLCRPCITSHNSVADGVKPEHASHTIDICLVVTACVGLNQKPHHYVSLKPLFDLAMCDVFSKMF